MQQPRLNDTSESARFKNFGGWRDYVNAHFTILEMTSRACAPFRASATNCRLGDYSLTHIGSAASRVERTPALARRADSGYLKIMRQLAGRLELTQDRRSVCLGPGGATLCDTPRPYRIRLDEGARLAVLLVPYRVDSRLPRYAERMSATELTDLPTMQAVLGAITGPARSQPAPNDPGIGNVMQAVGTMLAGTFARAAQPNDVARDAQRLQRTEHFIATHLASSNLTPTRLAAAVCLSRRSLYALLARHDLTPARLIAETRLQHARVALATGQQKITDIALAHGFTDSASFSHAFKNRFGLPPSVWQAQHAD